MQYSEWKDAGAQVFYLGNSKNIDVKSKFPTKYNKLTADNFIIESTSSGGTMGIKESSWLLDASGGYGFNFGKTYNASAGILTVNSYSRGNMYQRVGTDVRETNKSSDCSVKVYLVIGKIKNA